MSEKYGFEVAADRPGRDEVQREAQGTEPQCFRQMDSDIECSNEKVPTYEAKRRGGE